MAALRSSPMASDEQEATDDEESGAAAVGGLRVCVAGGGLGWEATDESEDRRDLDTRLSRASNPWVAGPRIRYS
jgi:hypothetical protein